MPRTSCGAPMAFGCSRWTTAGAGSSPPSSIGTPSVSAGMSASAATASAALQPISMGLAGLYGSTAAGAARGLALRMDHGSQYLSDHFTNQIKFLGHPAVLRLRRRAPDQRRRRAVQSHAEGTDHPWSHLPQHRGAAGRRPRLRRTLQCPVDRRKKRLPEPRSSSSGVARRDLNQARRVRQTCVQGTGCATRPYLALLVLRFGPIDVALDILEKPGKAAGAVRITLSIPTSRLPRRRPGIPGWKSVTARTVRRLWRNIFSHAVLPMESRKRRGQNTAGPRQGVPCHL